MTRSTGSHGDRSDRNGTPHPPSAGEIALFDPLLVQRGRGGAGEGILHDR